MKLKKDNGYVTVVALMVLVILTLIGISASRTSTTDILVARNLIPYKQDFYTAEGGQNEEAIKVGRGDYPVVNIEDSDAQLADSTEEVIPGHSYTYKITYKGHYPPPSGYSTLHFNRYDYEITTESETGKVKIHARYSSIAPRTE